MSFWLLRPAGASNAYKPCSFEHGANRVPLLPSSAESGTAHGSRSQYRWPPSAPAPLRSGSVATGACSEMPATRMGHCARHDREDRRANALGFRRRTRHVRPLLRCIARCTPPAVGRDGEPCALTSRAMTSLGRGASILVAASTRTVTGAPAPSITSQHVAQCRWVSFARSNSHTTRGSRGRNRDSPMLHRNGDLRICAEVSYLEPINVGYTIDTTSLDGRGLPPGPLEKIRYQCVRGFAARGYAAQQRSVFGELVQPLGLPRHSHSDPAVFPLSGARPHRPVSTQRSRICSNSSISHGREAKTHPAAMRQDRYRCDAPEERGNPRQGFSRSAILLGQVQPFQQWKIVIV